MNARFRKEERLKSRKVIQSLFNRQGNSIAQYPLRLIWMPVEERKSAFPAQFGVSVPKRRFKQAVNRNTLKRRIRESYRLQKHRIYEALTGEEQQFALMVLYTGQDILPYSEIDQALQQLLRRFLKKRAAQKRQTNQKM